MTKDDFSNRLCAIWQDQSLASMTLTPDELRKRAQNFQRQIRRRNFRDYICGIVVVVLSSWAALTTPSLVTSTGAVMVGLWGLYFVYALNRFGSSRVFPSDVGEKTVRGFHREQLERQRVLAMSRPWGIALSVPGMVLFAIGMQLSGKHPADWQMPIILIGLYMFVCIAAVIDGHLVADRLQREIDGLDDETQ